MKALQQDYCLLYTNQRKPKDLPWSHPARSISYDKNLHKTLFSQNYLSVVFDEAQIIRNCGPRQSSALLILEQCSVRLILTATPLQTSTKVRDSLLSCHCHTDAYSLIGHCLHG
jgi:TATA-binding protein-associated factor